MLEKLQYLVFSKPDNSEVILTKVEGNANLANEELISALRAADCLLQIDLYTGGIGMVLSDDKRGYKFVSSKEVSHYLRIFGLTTENLPNIKEGDSIAITKDSELRDAIVYINRK